MDSGGYWRLKPRPYSQKVEAELKRIEYPPIPLALNGNCCQLI